MDLIPLAKIPCLLLVTGYHHLAYTPPNPPASAKNRPFVPSLADRIVKGMVMIHTQDYIKVRTNRKLNTIHDDFMIYGY